MIVTNLIEISKKQCKVMIDDEFAFVLYKGELPLYGIKKGQSLDDSEYEKIINEVLMKRTKLRAMNLLKSRAYTEKKLRDKLHMGQYPEVCIEEAISYVKSYGYVNDVQYASDYLFYHGGRLNKQQVFLKLREKGISDEIIQNAYDNFCENGNAPEEEELIAQFLRKKKFGQQGSDRKEEQQKLTRSLLQKGFSYDKILRTFASYGKSDEENCDFSP
jgi:regulatory protein